MPIGDSAGNDSLRSVRVGMREGDVMVDLKNLCAVLFIAACLALYTAWVVINLMVLFHA